MPLFAGSCFFTACEITSDVYLMFTCCPVYYSRKLHTNLPVNLLIRVLGWRNHMLFEITEPEVLWVLN